MVNFPIDVQVALKTHDLSYDFLEPSSLIHPIRFIWQQACKWPALSLERSSVSPLHLQTTPQLSSQPLPTIQTIVVSDQSKQSSLVLSSFPLELKSAPQTEALRVPTIWSPSFWATLTLPSQMQHVSGLPSEFYQREHILERETCHEWFLTKVSLAPSLLVYCHLVIQQNVCCFQTMT